MEDKHLNVKAVNKQHPKGREAISHYQIRQSFDDTSLVEVLIETGGAIKFAWPCNILARPWWVTNAMGQRPIRSNG